MKIDKSWLRISLMLGLAVGLIASGVHMASAAKKKGKKKITEVEVVFGLERMVSHGRTIITDNQDLINDKEKGDKGFTADAFAQKLTNLMKEDKIDLSRVDNETDDASKAMNALLEAMKKVIADAQPIINQKGMGFKGFIPAVFARRSLEEFSQKSSIKGKLTAKVYRNAKNAPDDWEKAAIDKFLKADYPKNKPISEVVTLDSGEKALRYIKPEYYTGKCLKCHGEPKGERDITGGLKEGFRDGDAGAALSFVVPKK